MAAEHIADVDLPRVLVPYTDWNEHPDELAARLHEAVVQNREYLLGRNLVGLASRYGEAVTAEASVRKGQAEHSRIGHFAVMAEDGKIVGSASIYPGLPLRRGLLPLPPAALPSRLAVTYPFANPNVHAWTTRDGQDALPQAYADLVSIAGEYWKRPYAPKPWTVEPLRSPKEVHEAIALGG